MVTAARRAEFDYYQKGRALGRERFVPTPDPVIKAMLAAALELVEVIDTKAPAALKGGSSIVRAARPKPRR